MRTLHEIDKTIDTNKGIQTADEDTAT